MATSSNQEDSHRLAANDELWESAELRRLVAEARDLSALLATLVSWRKARDERTSLGYLCKRAGIASRGYLSEVLAGKKRLGQKYVVPMADALGLDGHVRALWLNAAELDAVDGGPEKLALEAHRAALIKHWTIERELMPKGGGADHYFIMEVFTAFGLFRNEPTWDDLLTYFGTRLERSLKEALETLTRWQLIESRSSSGYRVRSSQVVFSGSEDGFSHLRFIRQALERTRDEVPRWFGRRDEALLQSVIISVRSEDYSAFLADLRRHIELSKAKLESDKGDSLVAFNLFSFPLSGALAQRKS